MVIGRLLGVLLSVLLHLAIIAAALYQPPEKAQEKKQPTADASGFMMVELIDKDESTDSRADVINEKCPKTYDGIGIIRNPMNRVLEVAKGWPAHKAGIQPGDILSPWDLNETDEFLEFDVTRQGRKVHLKLRKVKICFRDGPF